MTSTLRALLAALAVCLLAAPPAHGAAATAVLVVDGKGFGHGVGMAQDGAYALGVAGKSTEEILATFYPGTSIGDGSGTVSVSLDAPQPAIELAFPDGGKLLDARLHPRLPPPGKPAVCFYPMSKRRAEPGRNWYTLPYDERLQLMWGHGRVGREFAGRVLQLVTGSVGLDDWEWAVTLFGEDPVALKECVYRMRFDEASAVYAEFGPFFFGLLGTVEEVLDRMR